MFPVAARGKRTLVHRFFGALGPGLITGAADDDPSGIGTYAVAGASLGYSTLWTALVTYPMMAAVQFTCAKIGMVSGVGLAGVLSQRYPRPLVYTAVSALFLANSINAGADIGAIAAAINLHMPAADIDETPRCRKIADFALTFNLLPDRADTEQKCNGNRNQQAD